MVTFIKLATFSGSERFDFHCVNLLLSASCQLWLIKQTLLFFLFTQSCIPQIFTILGEARDANALSTQSSQQTQVYLEKYSTFPQLQTLCKPLRSRTDSLIISGQLCGTLRWKPRSLFSDWRTINDIVTYVGGTLKNISSQFHKGNCQLCTPAPPWGMMGLCPSVSNTVFFSLLVHSHTALRRITKHSANPALRSYSSGATTQLIISPGQNKHLSSDRGSFFSLRSGGMPRTGTRTSICLDKSICVSRWEEKKTSQTHTRGQK